MRRIVLVAIATIVTLLLISLTAHADVNNFVVTDFTSEQTLSRDDPQGQLHIIERIKVNFTDNNHGLLRAIPAKYKNHSLNLKVLAVGSDSGAPTQYTTYESGGNTVLKIGDPSHTVTGQQSYIIEYRLNNVITFYDDHDELYWDVNGDQWRQPFEHVKVTLHVPHDLAQVRTPVCYTGAFKSTSQNCVVTQVGTAIVSETTNALGPAQTLTYVAGFQKGYFQKAGLQDTVRDYTWTLVKLLLLPLVVGLVAFCLWWKKGRDAKGRGTIVPEYDAPEGLSPLEVGAIIDFKVDNRDITATIIDMAVRGYIKIIETHEKKTFRKDTFSYSLELVNDDVSGLREHEARLLDGLFGSLKKGEVVQLEKSKNKLYKTAEDVRKDADTQLTNSGYFNSDPLKAGTMLYVFAAILFVLMWILGSLLGFALIAGGIVSIIILVIFGFVMPSRSAKGVAAKEHTEGLKLYLQTAEADRIKMLESPNAPYAANAAEPVRTVELFEKLLPYAVVLGVEDAWAKQFADLYKAPPDWYAGSNSFTPYYLAHSVGSGMQSAVSQAFTAPSSSSSSGFGGGFSGGGGGGGGGGGW